MVKKFFVILFVLMILCVSCKPSISAGVPTAPQYENSNKPNILDGTWTYKCDVLGFNRFTWVSSIQLENAEMIVEIDFDDWDINEYSDLAFKLYSQDYTNDWLYLTKQGDPTPGLTYFDRFGFIEDYPGGYEAFEKELKDKNMDWVTMYKNLRKEWLNMYFTQDLSECHSEYEVNPDCADCLTL